MDLPFPVMVIVTLVSALGFALFFNVNKKHIASATLGGVLTWLINYIATVPGEDPFFACMIASIFAAIYAESLARYTRTPTAVFFVISVIPLIPGRALYYTMYNAVSGNLTECAHYGVMTLEYAAGIAVGICLIAAIVQTWDMWAAEKLKRITKTAKKAARVATNKAEEAVIPVITDNQPNTSEQPKAKDQPKTVDPESSTSL